MTPKKQKPGRDLHAAPGQPLNDHPDEFSTLVRVRFSRSELLALKARTQKKVDHYSHLGRDLTPAERAGLLAALRTIRAIGKVFASKRSRLSPKAGHHD